MLSYEVEMLFETNIRNLSEGTISVSRDGEVLRQKIYKICEQNKEHVDVDIYDTSFKSPLSTSKAYVKVHEQIAKLGKTYIPMIMETSGTGQVYESFWTMVYKNKVYIFSLIYDHGKVALLKFTECNEDYFEYPLDVLEYVLSISDGFTLLQLTKKTIRVTYKNKNCIPFCNKIANYVDTKHKGKYKAVVSGLLSCVRIDKI